MYRTTENLAYNGPENLASAPNHGKKPGLHRITRSLDCTGTRQLAAAGRLTSRRDLVRCRTR